MNTHIDTLESLIAPTRLDEFFQHYWETRPLIINRNLPEYYNGLLSLEDVDHMIASTGLRFPALGLVKDGVRLPPKSYSRDVPWGGGSFTGMIDVDRVYEKYAQGTTIILEALHHRWQPLAILCRNLESQISCQVQTNVYLTPKGAQGFAPHYDTHDVLVLQIAGHKHWRIFDSPIRLPHKHQTYQTSGVKPEKLLSELELQAGDLIYLPRGFIHEALTSESYSLHITVGFITYTWLDVFDEVIDLCKKDRRFRKSLPIRFAEFLEPSAESAKEFASLFEKFAEIADLNVIMNRIARNYAASRVPVSGHRLMDINALDRINENTSVTRRQFILHKYVVTPETNSVRLIFEGKEIRLPDFVSPALEYILNSTDRLSATALPGPIDLPGKVVLIRRLIAEGFLTLAGDES